jgi:hypothetical protein
VAGAGEQLDDRGRGDRLDVVGVALVVAEEASSLISAWLTCAGPLRASEVSE